METTTAHHFSWNLRVSTVAAAERNEVRLVSSQEKLAP